MRFLFLKLSLVFLCGGAGADERWQLSYDAGYFDSNGAYAGGSEIMHLVGHKGKLYAANGYWEDARWVIPPDHEKQSAQVLRLDEAGGKWEVDLDMGKNNDRGLRYMKGNILKSVTFTRDAEGRPLEKPENLLVMSSGASLYRGGAVSVWVRDDETGTWEHTLVRHGSNAGGVRWVPRDLEVYKDKVTGKEGIFLSLGNPGIVRGLYDPDEPGRIRWERHLEFPFPEEGVLRVRPLGVTIANGSLLFSAGGSIYQRVDGERPTYKEVHRSSVEADPDVGGIRGLTTVANPNGDGESLLYLWAPGERAEGQIRRLDPDGKGGFTEHTETSLFKLMGSALDVPIRYSLGAHNMMYPMKDPQTGETVHITGFQGNLGGKDHLKWKPTRLYGGALYAVRTADAKYKVLEVNNAWQKGKPVLVAARTFCESPFGDNQIYIGGHDSSNRVSDDMAWVFNASDKVAVSGKKAADAEVKPLKSPRLPRVEEGPIYELRIYVANEKRFQHMLKRFREHTDRIFKKNGMEPVGYWTRTEGTERERRTFYYVLKHPSRQNAYQNWNNFNNDPEWKRVLDQPEFQRLLNEKPESIFMVENDYSEKFRKGKKKEGGVYELRTYEAPEGKLAALNDRFRNHTTRIFQKHGMTNIGYWTPFDNPESGNTLIYLVQHESRVQADANWKAFLADPEWQKVAEESQRDGRLLAKKPERVYLKATEYSPLK